MATLRMTAPSPEALKTKSDFLKAFEAVEKAYGDADRPAMRRRRVLGVVHDWQAGRARIGQRVAQDRGGTDRRSVVREAHDAGVTELAERCELLALPASRHRAVRQQFDR